MKTQNTNRVASLVLAVGIACRADESRHETTVITNGVADITIAEYETGQIVWLDDGKGGIKYQIVTRNQLIETLKGSPVDGTTVRGPAIFRTIATPPSTPPPYNVSGMTVKITPVSFPPSQTLILPPGTNQFHVSMETSTNLVSWQTGTNGVYGSPETARFFRLRMVNLSP